MLTVLSKKLAVTRSGRPSPLTSATATETGSGPTVKDCCAWKEPSPLPNSTDTLPLKVPVDGSKLPPELAVLRSGRPSPLTSATATADGVEKPDTVCWLKESVVAPGAVWFRNTVSELL